MAKKKRRKMSAKQRAIFGPRKSKKAKRRRAATKIIEVRANPKRATMAKKRRKSGKKRTRKFLSNPKRRRFRRNPRMLGAGFASDTLMPAAIGAAGALAVDMILGNLPIPDQMRQGPLLPLTRIAAAIGVGMAVSAASTPEAGAEATAGGLVVTLYGLAKNMILTQTSLQMGRYVPLGGIGPRAGMSFAPGPGGAAPLARFVPVAGQSPAIRNRLPGPMGYMNPARMDAPISRGALRGLN